MLAFDCEAMRARITGRFGGNLAAVARAWPRGLVPPNRSTILRWVRGETLPRGRDDLLGLAGALDLDPFALWRINATTFTTLCERMFAASLTGSWPRLLPALSFLDGFVRSSRDWPAAPFARRYFGRDWVAADHRHASPDGQDYFKAFALEPGAPPDAGVDQVWHFAWRPAPPDAWRPYGFVRRTESELRLYAFSGNTATAAIAEGAPYPRCCVETWIGRGPAEFRIASLHQFSMKSSAGDDRCEARVRFA